MCLTLTLDKKSWAYTSVYDINNYTRRGREGEVGGRINASSEMPAAWNIDMMHPSICARFQSNNNFISSIESMARLMIRRRTL